MYRDAELKNPVAELDFPDSGLLISAKDARPGEEFFCPDPNCFDQERRLFRKKSIFGRPFFSHRKDFDHPVSGETLLHKLAVRYFRDLDEFELPAISELVQMVKLNRSATTIEYNGLKSIKPDVRIQSNDGKIYFVEIFVTHETRGAKVSLIGGYNIATVEINLNDFYKSNFEACKSDLDFLHSSIPLLINDPVLKQWVFHPDLNASGMPDSPVSHDQSQSEIVGIGSKGPTGMDKLIVGGIIAGMALMVSPRLRRLVRGVFRFISGKPGRRTSHWGPKNLRKRAR